MAQSPYPPTTKVLCMALNIMLAHLPFTRGWMYRTKRDFDGTCTRKYNILKLIIYVNC